MTKLLPLGLAAASALVLGMAALAQDLPEPREHAGTPEAGSPPPAGGRAIARTDVADLVARGFPLLDTNGDGAVSRSEYDAFREARRAMMMARRGGGGGDAPRAHGGGGGMTNFLLGPRWFEVADANGDGRVTLAEAQAAALAQFDRADADHDGLLTADERHAAMAAMRSDDRAPPPR